MPLSRARQGSEVKSQGKRTTVMNGLLGLRATRKQRCCPHGCSLRVAHRRCRAPSNAPKKYPAERSQQSRNHGPAYGRKPPYVERGECGPHAPSPAHSPKSIRVILSVSIHSERSSWRKRQPRVSSRCTGCTLARNKTHTPRHRPHLCSTPRECPDS